MLVTICYWLLNYLLQNLLLKGDHEALRDCQTLQCHGLYFLLKMFAVLLIMIISISVMLVTMSLPCVSAFKPRYTPWELNPLSMRSLLSRISWNLDLQFESIIIPQQMQQNKLLTSINLKYRHRPMLDRARSLPDTHVWNPHKHLSCWRPKPMLSKLITYTDCTVLHWQFWAE